VLNLFLSPPLGVIMSASCCAQCEPRYAEKANTQCGACKEYACGVCTLNECECDWCGADCGNTCCNQCKWRLDEDCVEYICGSCGPDGSICKAKTRRMPPATEGGEKESQ
jgi:hypothetical protein